MHQARFCQVSPVKFKKKIQKRRNCNFPRVHSLLASRGWGETELTPQFLLRGIHKPHPICKTWRKRRKPTPPAGRQPQALLVSLHPPPPPKVAAITAQSQDEAAQGKTSPQTVWKGEQVMLDNFVECTKFFRPCAAPTAY